MYVFNLFGFIPYVPWRSPSSSVRWEGQITGPRLVFSNKKYQKGYGYKRENYNGTIDIIGAQNKSVMKNKIYTII